MNASLPVFLSAYDPAELPGGTVDPLGFTAGYLALADAFFPGMTAAAAQATYFPMLCAGLFIADAHGTLGASTAAIARKQRIEVALRFERLWALACALQVRSPESTDGGASNSDASSKTSGLRGVTYVQREVERLTQAGAKQTGTQFSLLAQQYRYGAFGIYGGVAEELRLLDKSTFAPTPGFGEAIGRSFLDSTIDGAQRKELVRAAVDVSATIRVSTLRTWGARAYAGSPLAGEGNALFREALVQNPMRARMLELAEGAARNLVGTWSDRELLAACAEQASEADDPSLFLALQTALAYDTFLRSFTLIFERTLWLCRTMNDAEESSAVFADPVILETCEGLSERAAALIATSDQLIASGQRDLLSRGRGILEVARRLTAGSDAAATVNAAIKRHARIQGAKVERGRPKQAWIEERGTQFVLTSTRVGSRLEAPKDPDHVRAPDWRFGAALSLLSAVGRLADEAAA